MAFQIIQTVFQEFDADPQITDIAVHQDKKPMHDGGDLGAVGKCRSLEHPRLIAPDHDPVLAGPLHGIVCPMLRRNIRVRTLRQRTAREERGGHCNGGTRCHQSVFPPCGELVEPFRLHRIKREGTFYATNEPFSSCML